MLSKISRYIFIVFFIIVSAIYLPDFYWKLSGKRASQPTINYSPIIRQFVGFKPNRVDNLEYFDFNGNKYTRVEFEKLLPFLFFRDLEKWDLVPKNVQGIPIDPTIIRRNFQNFGNSPSYLHNPMIQLYPLFESESDFTNLSMPDELFRITDRMEFIGVRQNVINEKLSVDFTTALSASGFTFPARLIAGNPTTRKPFDEGYFIVDAAGYVFHVKMVKGQALCHKTTISPGLGIRYIAISEDQRREYYGFIITNSAEVYLITYDNYKLVRLPLPNFDPDQMRLRFYADPIYRTISYHNSETVYCFVTDRQYNLVDSIRVDLVPYAQTIAGRIEKMLFPFKIVTESETSAYKSFDLQTGSDLSLTGIFASLIILIIVKRVIRKEKFNLNPFDYLVVALTGVFGLLAVLIIRPEVWDKGADPFGY